MLNITISKIAQCRKILDVYLVGYFSEWFTPSDRDMNYLAEAFLQDIQRWGDKDSINEFLASKKVGDWSEGLDEIINEIFLDNPEPDYMEW